jgi:hypothetical protein
MSRNKIYCLFFLLAFLLPGSVFAKTEGSSSKQKERLSRAIYVPQPDYVYDDGAKRDPFIPIITADGRYVQLERTQEELAESELKLEGIVYDKYGMSYAIVNSSVVKIGDLISDYQVLKIDDNKVVFIREGQTKEVLLQKED